MEYQVEHDTQLMNFLFTATQKKKNDLKHILKYGLVKVDGHIQTHYAYPLYRGQIVTIEKKKAPLPFEILYEDKELIVIDKPCGLLSEATDKENQKTAYALVRQYLAKKKESLYLVHRLDQYTSGLLMFVKTRQLYELLTKNWNHYVKVRGYMAIVEGQMPRLQGTIENYLAESKSQNVYITSRQKGKKAITHYRVIMSNRQYCLLEVHLDTGRKNQIRVHMSSLHHPIVGDMKYHAQTNPLQRLGLHAHELMVIHPLTHREMRFVSQMPTSFQKLFKKY